MMKNNILIALFAFLFASGICRAQVVERVYSPDIATVQFYKYGNQQAMPIYTLNSDDRLQLEFDDLGGRMKNYYYTYQLCDYNWQPVAYTPFDYIKGLINNRITTYRYSSLALTNYVHYQAFLPERQSMPTKSGNYLLKVYEDGDTTKLIFTRQFLVLDVQSAVLGTVVQPLEPRIFTTHQRIKFTVALNQPGGFSVAQQVKAVVLQNNRWDNDLRNIKPTFVRNQNLEFNTEGQILFPGGKEWRWLDLRSLRLQSDRIDSGSYSKTGTQLYMKPDIDRSSQRYVYFPDYDGGYNISTYETINPLWQGDYATVTFRFKNPNGILDKNKKLYLVGKFNDFLTNEQTEMKLNDSTGFYEKKVFLKQGYYNYTYILMDESTGAMMELEGNYWETQNTYTILIYYKGFADRNDQLIGVGRINSRTDKPGFIF